MKKIFWLALFVLAGCQSAHSHRDVLYQISTLPALSVGLYDGTTEARELPRHGDIGIGTFQSLNGELILVGGVVYQVKADGVVARPSPQIKIPFACVTFFENDLHSPLPNGLTYAQFKESGDSFLPNKNLPYAIHLKGTFKKVIVRSVPPQKQPYPPLSEAVKHQSVFERTAISGVIVGFRMPEYLNGINVPGYHLHFISRDRQFGGHVLDFTVEKAELSADFTSEIELTLPTSDEFKNADFSQAQEGIRRAEK